MMNVMAQELPQSTEEQLERITNAAQAEPENEDLVQQFEQARRNRVNLNHSTISLLRELNLITDLQIESLFTYRRLLGDLVHIYELQAVPYWDVTTIRHLLPYVYVGSSASIADDLRERLRDGTHNLLLRLGRTLQNSKGFDKRMQENHYAGSPLKLLLRYRYSYKNLLQFGMLGEKDAGEQWAGLGMDFYSFHFFARQVGKLSILALGDFTINMGQGLIQWQGHSIGKGSDALSIKQQSPIIRPYNAAGEHNFHRGVAVTFKHKNIDVTLFGSLRKLSVNTTLDTQLVESVTSINASGYHRTSSELAGKNKLGQTALGWSMQYSTNHKRHRFKIGINSIFYRFSMPLSKKEEPYQVFAILGQRWYNLSLDHSYTYKNIHLFGETAIDMTQSLAFLHGLMVSVDPRVDVSILYRKMAPRYQAMNTASFGENSSATNEQGLYLGMTFRPVSSWRIDVSSDTYRFPWLKYRVDAPSGGYGYLIQLSHKPNKQVELFLRFHRGGKQGNGLDTGVTRPVVDLPSKNLRLQVNLKVGSALTLRQRIESCWFGPNNGADNRSPGEEGFLYFFDVIFTPPPKSYTAGCRLQYFETDGYNSRLYAYENDVLYASSIPAFFDKGLRFYVNASLKLNRRMSTWVKFGATIYKEKSFIGSGLDEITGSTRSEFRFQFRYLIGKGQ
ncbi:MAG: hypothetical protein H7Y42_12540 [Chitinophagaceae bacterium]|nr:hypothetical protein [Chitinophagaceae bacterium]